MPRQTWALTQEDVTFLIDFSIQIAGQLGVAVAVAVVDAGGAMLGLLRMDNAKFASSAVSERKAWTSSLFQRPSSDYSASTAPGGAAFGLQNAFPGQFVPMPGGRPILIGSACVGGIGVSGASGEQDDTIAQAAVAAFAGRANAAS